MMIECLGGRLTVVGFDREEALQTDEVYLAVIEQARDEV
jgi:transposase